MGIKGLAKLLSDEAPESVKEVPLQSLHGRKIAVDASMAIYQFLIAIRSGGGNNPAVMLTNEAGETTSHIQGLFNRTIRFLTEGIRPAFVFDGKPPEFKSGELMKRREKRKKAEEELKAAKESENVEEQEKQQKRLVVAGKKENEDCRKLLRLMGVPVIEAPCEAEAQASALAKAGVVWAVATEDMDALTFATPVLLRKMTFASSNKKAMIQQLHYDKAVAGLGLSHDEFVDLCILLGCDYCDSIGGIGPKTALKLIREHKNIETILKNIDHKKYKIPNDWIPNQDNKQEKEDKEAEKQTTKKESSSDLVDSDEEEEAATEAADTASAKEGEDKPDNESNNDGGDDEDKEDEFIPVYVHARRLFKEHEVLTDVKLKWEPCKAEELTKFLVDECGFNPERVKSSIEKLQAAHKKTSHPQTRMDDFFKVIPKVNKATSNSKDKDSGKGKRKGGASSKGATGKKKKSYV